VRAWVRCAAGRGSLKMKKASTKLSPASVPATRNGSVADERDSAPPSAGPKTKPSPSAAPSTLMPAARLRSSVQSATSACVAGVQLLGIGRQDRNDDAEAHQVEKHGQEDDRQRRTSGCARGHPPPSQLRVGVGYDG